VGTDLPQAMGDDGVTMVITVQYFDGCPGWEVAGAHLGEAATQLGGPSPSASRHWKRLGGWAS